MTSPPMTTSPSITSPDRRRSGLVGLLPWLFAAVVVGYAMVVGGYAATVVSFALIYAVFVTGLNLFMGFAAQVSFGQNAFAAIGGYLSAVLTASPWLAAPARHAAGHRGRRAGRCDRRLPHAQAEGPLPRHGHARHRPDHPTRSRSNGSR
jgi:hypothetical protein